MFNISSCWLQYLKFPFVNIDCVIIETKLKVYLICRGLTYILRFYLPLHLLQTVVIKSIMLLETQ